MYVQANMRRRQLAREIEILTTVSHPNVIALKDVFEDDCHVYLVLELVQGGELFDKIVQVFFFWCMCVCVCVCVCV
jgi:serine/threonine protein kinase